MTENNENLQINHDTMQGMYLTFDLAGEGYGLEIRHVTEIIGIQKVTNIPDMPEHVIGVLNLRGKVIPIIDVRLRLPLSTLQNPQDLQSLLLYNQDYLTCLQNL